MTRTRPFAEITTATPPAERDRSFERWRRLAWLTAAVVYLLIVLGGVVRVTDSGLGCGDDWPLCNGRLVPVFDTPTSIEYGHRLVAAIVAALVSALTWSAWRRRARPEWLVRSRLSLAAAGVLVVQILLGAVTVWLELPPWSVVLHLGTAMLLLSLCVVAAIRPSAVPTRQMQDVSTRVAVLAAGLAAVVVLLGALVANLGAAPACQGFPLCNGDWLPGGHWRIQLHWAHRATAYLLVVGTLALPWLARRYRGARRGVVRSASLAAGLALLQTLVAAGMVLHLLPSGLRVLHVAIGTALFAVLIAHAWWTGHVVPIASGRSPGGQAVSSSAT